MKRVFLCQIKAMLDHSSVKWKKSKLNSDASNFAPKKEQVISDFSQERRVSIQKFVSGNLQELDEKVKTLMELSQNTTSGGSRRAYICKVCGHEGHGTSIRDHIEANHLKGISIPCNTCDRGLLIHKPFADLQLCIFLTWVSARLSIMKVAMCVMHN